MRRLAKWQIILFLKRRKRRTISLEIFAFNVTSNIVAQIFTSYKLSPLCFLYFLTSFLFCSLNVFFAALLRLYISISLTIWMRVKNRIADRWYICRSVWFCCRKRNRNPNLSAISVNVGDVCVQMVVRLSVCIYIFCLWVMSVLWELERFHQYHTKNIYTVGITLSFRLVGLLSFPLLSFFFVFISSTRHKNNNNYLEILKSKKTSTTQQN